MRIDVDGPDGTSRVDDNTGPAERAVERLVAADHETRKGPCVVGGDIGVEGTFGVDGRKNVIGPAIVAAEHVHKMHAGAMVRGWATPAGVLQRVAKAVERGPAIKRRIDGITAWTETIALSLAERVGDFVTFVP